MNDYDNLPAGATPLDASGAGVSRWDDPHIASAKLMTKDLENANALRRQQDSGAQSSAPAGSSTSSHVASNGFHPNQMAYISQANMISVRALATSIEGPRLALIAKREKATKPARQFRSAAIVGVLITTLIVLFSFKLPLIPPKYMVAEYLAVRICFLACIAGIFVANSRIKKAYDPEEKRLETLAQCVVRAIKDSGGFPKAGSYSDGVLLGKFKVPLRDLTPQFLLALNDAVLTATGRPMSYPVYRFREEVLWKKALFIPYATTPDRITAQVSDPVSLEDLKQLAA